MMSFLKLLYFLEKYLYIKKILTVLFILWQIILIKILYSNSLLIFYFYLICFALSLPFILSFLLLINFDLYKKEPDIAKLTNKELLKRYQFSRHHKFSFSDRRHIFIKTISDPKSKYNHIGNYCNAIILSYLKYDYSLVFIGISLNWLLLIYILIITYPKILSSYKKYYYNKKGHKCDL